VPENGAGQEQNVVRLRLLVHNARLVDARKEKGFKNADDFARAVGMPRYRLRLIETLKVIPTEDELCKMACVLVETPDYLFPDYLRSAIAAQVFSKRQVELAGPQLVPLTAGIHPALLTDGGIEAVGEGIDNELLRETLNRLFHTLSPREVRVLTLRFGLEDGRARTLDEVAPMLDVTRERVRQIEGKALRKLRHRSRRRELKEFLT